MSLMRARCELEKGLLGASWGSPGGPLGLPKVSQIDLGEFDEFLKKVFKTYVFYRLVPLSVRQLCSFERNVEQTSAMSNANSCRPTPGTPDEEPNWLPVTDVLREFPRGSH